MPARRNPADVTGRQADELAKQYAEEQAEAASRMSTITAQAEASRDDVIDLQPRVPEVHENFDVEIDAMPEVSVAEPHRTIRVNANLEAVTIGVGNTFDFEEGRKYRVPKAVADHLEEKHYVWH